LSSSLVIPTLYLIALLRALLIVRSFVLEWRVVATTMSIYHASTSCPITYPHVFSLRPLCFLHVPWHHTFNLCCTCAHHEEPMSLDVIPNPNSLSRLFPILLDPKFFQTALDFVTWLPGHVLSIRCRLIKYYLIYVRLTLTLAKVCPHPCAITLE